MTFLTSNRNHILATFLSALEYSLIATFLGVYPSQFATLYMSIKFLDYFSHYNLKISYGKYLEKILVSPMYHRAHHSTELPDGLKDHSVNFANVEFR